MLSKLFFFIVLFILINAVFSVIAITYPDFKDIIILYQVPINQLLIIWILIKQYSNHYE